MFVYTVWIAGLVLELAVLARSLFTRMYLKFPTFYIYLSCVFASSASLWVLYRRDYAAYGTWFWRWQFVTLLLGYGVVLEIMHVALARYRGAERLARYAGFAAFGVIFVGLGISTLAKPNPLAPYPWWVHRDALERDLRIVEAVFLAIVAAAILYYGIEVGRNVGGLLIGLGIFIGVSLVNQALMIFLGSRFQSIYSEFESVAYVGAVGVWLVALWSPAEEKNQDPPNGDGGYKKIAEGTRKSIKDVRSRFLPVTGTC
jgi:hypothetical protein